MHKMSIVYRVNLYSEEFDILKQLAQRWLNELQSQKTAIEELPEGLREGAFDELDEAIKQAENICRELEKDES